MKKYFLKYLPVEGKIQCGPHVPVFKGDKQISFYTLDTPEKLKLFLELPGSVRLGVKPAKLFLCSRDIQVGDEFTDSLGHKRTCKSIRESDGWLRYDNTYDDVDEEDPTQGYFTIPERSYKVIGEISPEATWVKENDEFDEKDVKFSIFDEDFHVSTEDTYEEAYNHSYYEAYFAVCKLICLIKGPCGHFH